MKKLLLLSFIFLLSATISNAQKLERGDAIFAIGINAVNCDKAASDWLAFGSINGTFILSKHFAIEVNAMYTKDKRDSDILLMGGGLRLYPTDGLFLNIGPQFIAVDNESSFLFQVGMGYDLFLTDNIYMEPAIHYNAQNETINKRHNRYSHYYEDSTYIDLTGFGFSLSIGVKF